jgi:hypothetical protein
VTVALLEATPWIPAVVADLAEAPAVAQEPRAPGTDVLDADEPRVPVAFLEVVPAFRQDVRVEIDPQRPALQAC